MSAVAPPDCLVFPLGVAGILKPRGAHACLSLAGRCRFEPFTAPPGWLNFTAVGGALLYFGARRPWREMLVPLAALMATDYFLTVYSYHYTFAWQSLCCPRGRGT